MITYEDILIEAENHGLVTREKPLRAHKGRIKGSRIAINNRLTERDKKCVLAEELGHHYTASGDILDQSSTLNRKQELHGRVYAYNKLIGLMGIVDAYKNHCMSLSESAEYLEVTEDFLQDALSYYKSKYGKCTTIDNYIVFFEPCIAVLEIYN